MIEETTTPTKRTLRHEAISRRKQVDPAERARAGARLAGLMDGLPLPDARATVAAYVSMGSEIETRPLLDALLAAGYRVLVPRLGAGLDVGWGELDATGLLRDMDDPGSPTHHRPDEPEGETLPPESLAQAALILVPALAVDRSGTRLGRGGGWYDRALAHRSPACPVLAVCWDWEVLGADEDPLPRETHDLPVDGALTPGGIVLFG
ncbi:5-formyltetrahydrofolate cyclo-ligase [Bifidobacterium santillanense]|nr:5-formyltetrahydrofolate cyclo-ligase [Bifidobacterium santillanense]